MPQICYTEKDFYFPPVEEADEEGLLLIGGKVTASRILEAYQRGIFPWYSEDDWPLWWSPDPRFVLYPGELHVSRGMEKIISGDHFEFKTDTAFEKVIEACATVDRAGQNGTWITAEMKEAYTQLFYEGHAHCAEAWKDGELVGGMYGIQLGSVFFGESMFHKMKNASKFVFIKFVQELKQEGVQLMDCQVYTAHVESLGGRLISRKEYLEHLTPTLSNGVGEGVMKTPKL
ncbi:MAG TPA: leucyl/phenylalanyl-tRNA--protein transferase [Flavisolibacter sp.]|nr:leucyl/phenylalanyl-tRNA--protein transferase [Flavisolibacter sp.]